jgi:hypothetical protein
VDVTDQAGERELEQSDELHIAAARKCLDHWHNSPEFEVAPPEYRSFRWMHGRNRVPGFAHTHGDHEPDRTVMGGAEAEQVGGDAGDQGADGVAGVAPELVGADGAGAPGGVSDVAEKGQEGGSAMPAASSASRNVTSPSSPRSCPSHAILGDSGVALGPTRERER